MPLLQQSYRRAPSGKGIDERVDACRRRLRGERAMRKVKAARQVVEQSEPDGASSESPDERRMMSVAEILSGAMGEGAWLERRDAPEVDAQPQRRSGLSVKGEVGSA